MLYKIVCSQITVIHVIIFMKLPRVSRFLLDHLKPIQHKTSKADDAYLQHLCIYAAYYMLKFSQRIKNLFNDFFDNIQCKTLDFKVESWYKLIIKNGDYAVNLICRSYHFARLSILTSRIYYSYIFSYHWNYRINAFNCIILYDSCNLYVFEWHLNEVIIWPSD